jgi:pyruvate,water dikinase
MALIAGIGDVDSAAPSWALWDLSRQVRASEELTAAFAGGAAGVVDRLRMSGSPAAIAFLGELDEFLAAHGSRGPNEWEILADVWETRPALALAAVDLMRRTDDAEDPRAKHEAGRAERARLRAAMEELLAGDPDALATFRAAMTSTDAHVVGRERSKANNVKVIHEARMATRELGRRLVARGAVADWRHLYMVTDAELDDFLADPSVLKDEVTQRWVEYRELFELEPPFVVNAEVPPLPSWPRRREVTATRASAGDELAGIAGCAGVARGRARVVLDVGDPAGLEPGDVLVTVATDPSWTPLFVPAAAVVTNTGAPASHAVIVARELGIPCVVSVHEATRRIPDGALVEVDGDHGVVRVLEVAPTDPPQPPGRTSPLS